MAAEQGRLEEGVPAEQQIMGESEAKGIMAEPEAEEIISASNNSDSSVSADTPPCLSHPDLLPSDSQDPLMSIQRAEGGEPSETSVQELGKPSRFKLALEAVNLQGFRTIGAHVCAAVAAAIYRHARERKTMQETGSSDTTQVTAGAYTIRVHSQPTMLHEPVQAQAVIQGMRTVFVEIQDPIAGPAKWCLSFTLRSHLTSDWTILRRTHPCPPIETAPGALPLVECGIVDSGGIKLSGVKLDPNAGDNWISAGVLRNRGCEFEFEGEYCHIKKGDEVICTVKKDDEGLYPVDEFDDSNLELGCPGCIKQIAGA